MNDKSGGEVTRDLGLFSLIAVIIGSTIGAGIFSLSGDMAINGANTGGVLVGWLVCGLGMFALTMCFFGLNKIKPELKNGIYSYASEGFGDFIGFNSVWGYWLSALFCNVAYTTLLFAAIGYFFPIFGEGNNIISIVCASIVIWIMNFLVLKGVKEAAIITVAATISKLLPIFIFILAIIFAKSFKLSIFLDNFWGESGGLGFLSQVKATTAATVWSFIGVEGAVVLSARAKKASDVGKSTVIGFISIFLIYILTSILSMGVMTRADLAKLPNPSMAGILEAAVGPWGAALINLGIILSLAGALLGWTIIAADSPYSAAKIGVFSKAFAKENKNGAPVFSLFVTNGIVQLFLIIVYFNESTYQAFYTLCASMIMIPYLFSALYYAKVTHSKEGERLIGKKQLRREKLIGIIGTAYGIWLLYAGGVMYLLISAILYAPGILVYIKGKKEKKEGYLDNTRDRVAMGVILSIALISIILIINGKINPF